MTIPYDTAALLALTAEDLADAIDDQRPGWPALAETARALLNTLTATAPGPRAEPDIDTIAARAAAAPAGHWIAWPDRVQIPWHALDDAEPESAWDHGRYLAVEDRDWYGTGQPPAPLWVFLAAARDDVLMLAAEVRRLRALLAARRPHSDGTGEWSCQRCGAAFFGAPPDSGQCPCCQEGAQMVATVTAGHARQPL